MARVSRNEAWRLLDRVHETLFPIWSQTAVALRLAQQGAEPERIRQPLDRAAYDLARLLGGLDETLLYGERAKDGTQIKFEFEGAVDHGNGDSTSLSATDKRRSSTRRGGEADQRRAA